MSHSGCVCSAKTLVPEPTKKIAKLASFSKVAIGRFGFSMKQRYWPVQPMRNMGRNMEKHGDTTLLYAVSISEPRFEIISVRTAREIGPACLFRFQSFEISADNHLCLNSYNETHFSIGRRERCLDSRSVELAMRFTTTSLRNTLYRSGYVHKRSSKIPNHG